MFGQLITPYVRSVLLARFLRVFFLFLVPMIARELEHRRRKRQRQRREKNDLIGRMRKNNRAARAARAARTLVEFFDVVCQTTA